jgi:molybdopterin synthase sulfur carrier subunit
MVAVVFYIPSYLRVYANGKAEVRLNTAGQTVAEALADLWSDCPALRDRVLTEQGEIRQHLNIFVGQENVKDGSGLATRIVSHCEITILPAISGG